MDSCERAEADVAARVVKHWVAAALVALAGPAFADDWRDELIPLKPGKFPLPRPQTGTYRFGWGAVSAAQAEIEFSRQKKAQLQLQLKLTAKTTGPVRALWQMDAEYTARCDAATLQPIFLQQTERYRKKTERTRADFTPAEVMRLNEIEPSSDPPPKPKRFEFSNVKDLQAALLLVRSQPLLAGDRYSMVVYPARTAYLARIDVVGREPVEVGGQRYPAVKLQLALQHITKKFELEPHEKFKNAYVWLSDDKDRLLLKIKAEVYVGSVWMELQSVKFTGE